MELSGSMKSLDFLGGLSGYQIYRGCDSLVGFSFGAMHMCYITGAVISVLTAHTNKPINEEQLKILT
jgi:hypothetical protein